MQLSKFELGLVVLTACVFGIILFSSFMPEQNQTEPDSEIIIQKLGPTQYRGIAKDGTEIIESIGLRPGQSEDDPAYKQFVRGVLESSYLEGNFKAPTAPKAPEPVDPTAKNDPWPKIEDPVLLDMLRNDVDSQQMREQIVIMEDTLVFPYFPQNDAARQLVAEETKMKRELYYKKVETEMKFLFGAKFEVVNSFWLFCMRTYKATAADFLKMAKHPQVIGVTSTEWEATANV